LKPGELEAWFTSNRQTLETAYLAAEEPWRQSGFSGPLERWEACRRPIADCIVAPGTFLDIGCANGFLLECLLRWTAERGIRIEPWGLDLSEKLLALARRRLPDHASNLLVGNALTWRPARRLDYVRTELCYVPENYDRRYVRHLIDDVVAPGGRLLVAEYRSRRDPSSGPWIDDVLAGLGFIVDSTASGFWEGKELTRIAVVPGHEGRKP
jgi:SAM-dependent methyltransferase